MAKSETTGLELEPGRVAGEVERWARPLVDALGDGFVAVYLYGSAADTDWDPSKSEANILLVAEALPSSALQTLAAARPGRGPMGSEASIVLMPIDQLTRATDTFALELAEVKYHGQLVLGRDVLAGLEIPDDSIRRHIERELRLLVVRLRRAYLYGAGDKQALVAVLAEAGSELAVCARGLHFLLGARSPLPTESALNAAADWAGVEPRAWIEAWRLHTEASPPLAAADLYLDFLDAAMQLLRRVDTHGES